jgi:hypothetical protein
MLINRISHWFYKISTGWVALVCLLIFLVFSALVLPGQSLKAAAYSGEIGSPDTSLYYSAERLFEMAEAYGAEGRAEYIRARFTFDLVFPLVYLAFLVTGISWLLKILNFHDKKWAWLNLFPLVAAIFDFLENISAAIVMARYPQTVRIIDHLAGVFTTLKWLSILASFIVLVSICAVLLIKFIKNHAITKNEKK